MAMYNYPALGLTVSIDITQLELGLAGQSQWTVDASDLRVKLNSAMHSDESGSGSLKDSLYLPTIKVGMLMKWISGHESHFVHPFARSGDEAFPNKAVAQPQLHTDIGDRWWGPVLAPDAHEAVGGVFPTDTFISTGWTLKIDVCVSDNAINNTGQRSSHARHATLRLFVASTAEALAVLEPGCGSPLTGGPPEATPLVLG